MRTKLALLAVVLGLSGCGTETPAVTSYPSPVPIEASTTPSLPSCVDSLKPGRVPTLDEVNAVCLDPDGGMQVLGGGRCVDGTHLFSADAVTGAPAGWYVSGQEYHASKDPAADPEYAKAFRKCNGD